MKQTLVYLLFSILAVQALSKPNNERVKEDKPLSHADHYDADGNHNPDYDHDAFLGEEIAKSFNDLTPEESKEKLGTIVDKIDEDKDGFVTEKELKVWIEHQQKTYVYRDADRHWNDHNVNNDDIMTWAEYNATTFSNLPLEVLVTKPEDKIMDFAKRVRRDKARWVAADINKDDNLDHEEFVGFIHAEERENMFDVYIQEAMEDIDLDQDGQISIDEYIADIYSRPREGETDEPGWVKTERESFMTHRDKNADGYMDIEEVKAWLLPVDYDHAEAEAKHLIYESDVNKDKNLSKDEILDKWESFVPSRALMAERDEL